ncbi:MAG: CDP-glucose 4,6-dehydratase [Anaeroplasmataceae bacterium]
MVDLSFFKDKKILITGHTGFKGSWLTRILVNAKAKVIGYSLLPAEKSLYNLADVDDKIVSIIADIRDYEKLKEVFDKYEPEIVIHLAAQPIVRESYKSPLYTYETNVMGTVNLLECVRQTKSVKSVLNVTTDKVYLNEDIENHPFKENEPLDGYDPYSNSKSCSELVTHSYKKSFFNDIECSISTARAGNVIGGGDFQADRIIPDCVRAIENKTDIIIRNPYSTRPYQHVLEPLFLYLTIVMKQYENKAYEGYYNIGPDDCDCVTTGDLVSKFCASWGNGLGYINKYDGGPHEAAFLKLDNNLVKDVFGWSPTWHIDETIDKIVEWTKVYLDNLENIPDCMDKQIEEFNK